VRGISDSIGIILVLAALIAPLVYVTVRDRRRNLLQRQPPLVGLSSKAALDDAVSHMARIGANVTARTETSVSFAYRKGPNPLYLIPLLLLLLLPGILYWMAASRNVNFTITATPETGGCRVLFNGEYGAGYGEYQRWLKTLPGADQTLSGEEEEVQESPALADESHSADIPAQIQRLAGLRDAGILTNEEFEAKKRELLDRL
jgi:Short C-terminal domain